jgi:ribonuclease D
MCRPRLIAFDLEWSQQRGAPKVGMLQIATDGFVLLYRPPSGESFPERLKKLLIDPEVLKFGVGIKGKVNAF